MGGSFRQIPGDGGELFQGGFEVLDNFPGDDSGCGEMSINI